MKGRTDMDYEAEYNNRARVPEHPEIIAGWTADAAAYRDEATCSLDVPYGDTDRCVIDLFRGENGAAQRPLTLFIHGGYWQAMDGKIFSGLARGLNAHGLDVAMATYDLCPSVTIGQIIDQIRRCCARLWVLEGRRIVAFGHSAGGHLTAAMLATDWNTVDAALPDDLVPAGYAISGLFDLEPLIGTSINAAVGLDAETARAASPLAWNAPAGRRLIAAVGGNESSEFLRQSQKICDVWGAAGVATSYSEIGGTDHFTVISGLADRDSGMVREIVELVKSLEPRDA